MTNAKPVARIFRTKTCHRGGKYQWTYHYSAQFDGRFYSIGPRLSAVRAWVRHMGVTSIAWDWKEQTD
jgi:hypothetical protein